MAQQKQLTWAELRVGLFVLAATALLVVTIFYVTGSSGLGEKYRLRTYLPEVDGLAAGAPVRVDGVDVGNVDSIVINSAKAGGPIDKSRNIEVVMRIQKKYQDYIRADSTAGLLTEGLLGNRYVDINRGFTGMVLKNDQELPGRTVTSTADVMESVTGLSKEATEVLQDVRSGKGTLGKLIEDDATYTRLNNALENIDEISSGVRAGNGTLGKLVTSNELYNNANTLVGHVDNVVQAVETQQGTLGKLVYGSQLHDDTLKFVDNGNGLIADARAGKGTLGKLITDDSLFTEYKQIGENLSTATAKLNSSDNTVGKFLSDPNLYDNLTGLAGEMRLLIGDFRADPKKYLSVKFTIF